ncbi:MAG: hypothetical protein MI922_25095 [Bacteroidales bacterium]|nr:hypothetical protein [Bacteroidales bacterium]
MKAKRSAIGEKILNNEEVARELIKKIASDPRKAEIELEGKTMRFKKAG